MEKKKLNRKSYFCTDSINLYIKGRCEELGISESAFVNICIDTYKTQRDAINVMGQMDDLMEKIDYLSKQNEDNK